MKVTAILCIRNEEAYLANCLRHLVHNGIYFFIIDNESQDSSTEIYRRREFRNNLVGVEEMRFHGVYSQTDQLQRKMAVIDTIKTDWVIHQDADEILHSCLPGESLRAGLSRLDAEGWNVVNFDEFVFLPVENDYVPDTAGYQPILTYYFFQRRFPRLMRAWRKSCGFSMIDGGGHVLTGPGLRMAPQTFVLRHYMFQNQEHALTKLVNRKFAAEDIARGWHTKRMNQPAEVFRFPPAASLKRLVNKDDHILDRSDPWRDHYWVPASKTRNVSHGIKE